MMTISEVTMKGKLLCLLWAMAISAGNSLVAQRRSIKTTALQDAGRSKLANLVVKDQQLTVNQLREDMKSPDHPISQYLNTPSSTYYVGGFYDGLVNYKMMAVMPEYNQRSKTGFIVSMPPPEVMGGVLRDADAKAIVVSLNKRSGGASYDEFRRFVAEQRKARIFTPGPIPVVWHDVVIDKIQVMHAAALGAAAITLQPAYCAGAEDLAALVQCSFGHKVEPIAMVSTEEEGRQALAAGARTLCLHSLDQEELLQLRSALPSECAREGSTIPLLYIAKLRAEGSFSTYSEIDQAWLLRDTGGFRVVWPSPEAVYCTGMGDLYAAIAAMRSKASRQFLSPRQFMMNRKKEGATEYLGDILY